MLRSVAGPYLWQETAWMSGERDRETKRDRVEERKREREELYVNVLNEEIIYKEEEHNYIKYGII